MHLARFCFVVPVVLEEIEERIHGITNQVEHSVKADEQLDMAHGAGALIWRLEIVFWLTEDVDAADLGHHRTDYDEDAEQTVEEDADDLAAGGGAVAAFHSIRL